MSASITTKRKSRSQRKFEHDSAQSILKRLNRSANSDNVKRVVELIELFKLAEDYREAIENAYRKRGLSLKLLVSYLANTNISPVEFTDESLREFVGIHEEAVRKLNRLLTRYRWFPTIRDGGLRLTPDYGWRIPHALPHKAKIEANLKRNDPKKYKDLKDSGKLNRWLQKEARLASEAMSSTTDKANLSQRAELAAEHLNPKSGQLEDQSETEESPEDEWLNNRQQKVIVTIPSDTR